MIESKTKQAIALTGWLSIPFLLYAILNPTFMGFDTYYFLGNICNGSPIVSESIATKAIFSGINCNFAGIKFLQYLLALVAVFGVAQTGRVLHKKGWLAGLFVLLAPGFVFEFAKLESENFAFPILFWANYFVIKSIKEKETASKIKNAAVGLALVGAAALFWQGAIYYLLVFSLMTLVATPFGLLALSMFWVKIMAHLQPNNTVWENTTGVGPIYLGIFLFSTIGLVLNPVILVPGFTWLAIGWMNSKLAFHAIPWLAVGTVLLFENKALNNLDKKYKQPIWATCKITLLTSVIALVLVSGLAVSLAQPPTQEQTETVELFVEIQKTGADAKNDWSYGHLVNFYGGKATAESGGVWEQDYSQGFILTAHDLNCLSLRQANEMKLYRCWK